MKTWLAVWVAALVVSSSQPASAQSLVGRFGLGLQLGDPFAVVGKYWLDGKQALQASVGSSYGHSYGGVGFTGDWVYQFATVKPSRVPLSFGFHAGVGAAVFFRDGCYRTYGGRVCYFDDSLGLGVRVPFAANLYFDEAPAEAYLELAPVFGLLPGVYSGWAAGLGGRWYF